MSILNQLGQTLLGRFAPSVKQSIVRDSRKADLFMLRILLIHWLAAAGGVAFAHGFFLMGIVGGGAIVALAYTAYRWYGGSAYAGMTMGICLMLFSALYIQQGLGRIEWHFHVFASMAFLIRYKDLKPLLAAVVTIAIHHLAVNFCQAAGLTIGGTAVVIFDYGTGIDIVLLHAMFVIVEAVVLACIIADLTAQFAQAIEANEEGQERLALLQRVINERDLSVRISGDGQEALVLNNLLSILNANAAVRTAFNSATSAMLLIDTDGRVTDANAAARRLFDTLASDYQAVGRTVTGQALPHLTVDDLLVGLSQRVVLTEHVDTEIQVGERTLRVEGQPVANDHGERLGFIMEWLDLTAERRIQSEVARVVQAASAGDLNARIRLEQDDSFFGELTKGFNTLVDVSEHLITDCTRVLSALAQGDLTQSVERDYLGQFGRLTTDVNRTVDRLRGMVATIKENAGSVHSGATALVSSSGALSGHMGEQVHRLQATADRMSSMTATVQENASSAHEANVLTATAREHAEHGGVVVGRAVTAMEEIQRASTKVTEITHVIDEIAFQTNLLALNASVEAARAAEHGRGFAVVASEVRSLAARSATAAKEINVLIEDSVQKISEGAALVSESGDTLQAIVESVQAASDVVGEIATASQLQSDGLKEISTSITEMDELTRQNSVLVGDTAGESQAMQGLATSLHDVVEAFTVEPAAGSDERGATLPLRATG